MLRKSIIFCLYWRRQGSLYQSFLSILEGNVYFVGLALTMAHIKLGIITSVDGTCSTVPACGLLYDVIQDHHVCTNKEKQNDYKIIEGEEIKESVETCSHHLLQYKLKIESLILCNFINKNKDYVTILQLDQMNMLSCFYDFQDKCCYIFKKKHKAKPFELRLNLFRFYSFHLIMIGLLSTSIKLKNI